MMKEVLSLQMSGRQRRHVGDSVFMLFLSVEMEIQIVLNTKKASETTGIKDETPENLQK